jgi:transcriptional regulator with PAS, ATPase and Fis domain
MKKLSDILAQTAESLKASAHPRVSVAWQDLDLVYTRVHNPSPDLGVDIIGKRLEDVIDSQEEARRLSEVKRHVIRTGQPYAEEIQVTFGGKKRSFDITIETTLDETGQVDGLISVNVDVTDLVEARRRLMEANTRLTRLLAEAMDNSVSRRVNGKAGTHTAQ